MAYFADVNFSVWETHAPLEQCIQVILSIELKQRYCEIWSQYLQYLQSYLQIFIYHLVAAVPLLETDNISLVCWYVIKIWPVLIACTWKNCILKFCLQRSGTNYRYIIWAKWSSARRCAMVHSACCITLLLASLYVVLPSECEKQSQINWTIKISPARHWVLLNERAITQPVVRDNPWHHIDQLCMRALTAERVGSTAAATCSARQHAPHSRSLNIFPAQEPMGLSSRCQLFLLASHHMALTGWRKNSNQIAWEIEIFSIFAWLVPRWSQSRTQGFKFSAAQSVDYDDQLIFMKHLVQRKAQFPCGILFLCLAQKQVQILEL